MVDTLNRLHRNSGVDELLRLASEKSFAIVPKVEPSKPRESLRKMGDRPKSDGYRGQTDGYNDRRAERRRAKFSRDRDLERDSQVRTDGYLSGYHPRDTLEPQVGQF